jgi:uncharacterized protein
MTYLKKISIGLLFVLTIIILLNITFQIFENHFIFKPKIYPEGNWHPIGIAPIDVWMKSMDGLKIHGWYLPYKQPKVVILYLHGNVGNVTDRYTELVKIHDTLSASIMVVDYRGFGRSEGQPDEKIIYDAQVAQDFLAKREHIKPQEIVLLGRSFGSAIAVDLAVRTGAKGLILISPFLSLSCVLTHHYPFLFTHLIMHNQFDIMHKIGNYSGPLLVIHGDADELVPIVQGKILFSLAKGPKFFFEVPKGKHFDPLSEKIYQTISNFIMKMSD